MLCSGCTRSGGGRRWWVLFPEVHFGESNVWVSSLHCTQRACMLQLAWLPPAGSRLRHPCSNIITKFQMMRLLCTEYLYFSIFSTISIIVARGAAVPGDAADTWVIWYTHPRAKLIFTDGLRVPAGYTESVIVTFPRW